MTEYIYCDNLIVTNGEGGSKCTISNLITDNSTVSNLSIINGVNIFNGSPYIVHDLSGFPHPVAGVITLPSSTNWVIVSNIDLGNNRIVCGGNVCLTGFSSETCSLFSSLGNDVALLTSAYTLPIHFLTLGCSVNARIFNLSGDGTNGLDLLGVNFGSLSIVCGSLGLINNYSNVVFTNCATLNIKNGITLSGTIGTVSFSSCLFNSSITNGNSFVYLGNTLTITRRFRVIFSSIIVSNASAFGITYSGATVPNSGIILNFVNFSGSGTYLNGIDETSNLTTFTNCIGIKNSSEEGSFYMINNTTATTIGSSSVYYKILGTTTPSVLNQKFTTSSSNLLTYVGNIQKNFFVSGSCSFDVSGANALTIIMAIFKNGSIVTDSVAKTTTSGGGVRYENIKFQTFIAMTNSDYIEIFVRNATDTASITVSDLNVITFAI